MIEILTRNETWILSDGTKGMENQSIALGKMLDKSFKLINYEPPFLLKKIPLLGKIYVPYFLRQTLKTNLLPSFIITTGRRMAGTSIALKSILKNKVKTIHIQNPKLSPENFDLLLIPEHDGIKGKNVIQTKGALCFFDNNNLKNFKNSKFNQIKVKNNMVLLLVGGNSKKYVPQNSEYFDLCNKVVKGVKSIDGQLIVIVSRRTPPKAIKILDLIFSQNLKNYEMFFPNQFNPYPQILKVADFVIVTSDSVNMISETATLSTPLFITHFLKENKKISSFIENLKKLEIVKSYEGSLFEYRKNILQTNQKSILEVNKFFRS